jgi:hypothetical protein
VIAGNKELTCVLFRILGNDLPPRHRAGQTLENLRFTLANEKPLEGCEKRWIINRVANYEVERELTTLLSDAGHEFIRLPFKFEEYAKLPERENCTKPRPWTMSRQRRSRLELHKRRSRLAYVTNLNSARNAAISDGLRSADWVLPWDGNCFITQSSWQQIRGVIRRSAADYLVVPMARVYSNAEALAHSVPATATEEPQLGFSRNSTERFSPLHIYGRRDKVELLWRLGVPGPWDEWTDDPWDVPRPAHASVTANYVRAGWVTRLSSGRCDLEEPGVVAARARASERTRAILAFMDSLDASNAANAALPCENC